MFSHSVQALAILGNDRMPRPVFLPNALDFLDEGERTVRLGLMDPDGVGAAGKAASGCK